MVHLFALEKGKFTEYCKNKGFDSVTCGCIKQGKNSPDPHVRKMANFAYNFGFKQHNKKCKNIEKQIKGNK